MAQRNRETLKSSFKQGSKPSERDFENLIDSMMNILDDGISKTNDSGLELSPNTETDTVLSVSNGQEQHTPLWKIALNRDNDSLEIRHCGSRAEFPAMQLRTDGSIVLGSDDGVALRHGAIRAKYREGALHAGSVAADGKWHDITGELPGILALEVAALAGNAGDRKQCVLVAVATCCSGRRPRIRQTRSHSGWFTRKIRLRWRRNKKAGTARLQAKTVWKYGSEGQIRYHITGLFEELRVEN